MSDVAIAEGLGLSGSISLAGIWVLDALMIQTNRSHAKLAAALAWLKYALTVWMRRMPNDQ